MQTKAIVILRYKGSLFSSKKTSINWSGGRISEASKRRRKQTIYKKTWSLVRGGPNSGVYLSNKSSIPVFYRRIAYWYEFGCVWIKARVAQVNLSILYTYSVTFVPIVVWSMSDNVVVFVWIIVGNCVMQDEQVV